MSKASKIAAKLTKGRKPAPRPAAAMHRAARESAKAGSNGHAPKEAPLTAAPPEQPQPWAADHVERWPVSRLVPYAQNAKLHTPEQVEQLAAAIKEWGWTVPILVAENGVIIAGHGRVLAAQKLGITAVPVMVARGWSDEKRRLYTIFDNKITEAGRWDYDTLKIEVAELVELGADVALTGLSADELQAMAIAGEAVADPVGEWVGMPEFEQNKATAFRTMVVHFVDEDAVAKFAKLVKVPFGDKTKFIWFPEQARIKTTHLGMASVDHQPKGFQYKEALPPGFEIPKSFDWVLAKDFERNPFAQVIVREGDRVMDCGGCIGTFTAAALEQGASRARCYEPMPDTIDVLTKNLSRYGDRAEIIRQALVPGSATTATLYSSGFPGAHSVIKRPKAGKAMDVPAIAFRNELLAFKPDVVKLDVEGAEYDLLASLQGGDLASINCLFIEFHPHPERDARARQIKAFLASEGLTVVRNKPRAFTAVRQ